MKLEENGDNQECILQSEKSICQYKNKREMERKSEEGNIDEKLQNK